MNKGPLIISIGASSSGTGKTTLGLKILRNLDDCAVIKYTKTAFYTSIIEEMEILDMDGKDTSLYIRGGAKKVIWLQSPPENLRDTLYISIERVSEHRYIIIEGNSPIEFLNPHVVLFLINRDKVSKKSAERIIKKADLILMKEEIEIAMNKVMSLIEKRELLKNEILKNSIQGKIPCPLIRNIAEKIGVSYKEAGEMADRLNIKISNCELGCF